MRIVLMGLICGLALFSGCAIPAQSRRGDYYTPIEAEQVVVPTFKVQHLPTSADCLPPEELIGNWLVSQDRETKRVIIGSKFNKRGNKCERVQFYFAFKDATICEVTMYRHGKSYTNQFKYAYQAGKLTFPGRVWMLGAAEFDVLYHSPSEIELRYADLDAYSQSRPVKSIYATSECRYDNDGCLYTTNLTGAPHNQKVMSVFSPFVLKRIAANSLSAGAEPVNLIPTAKTSKDVPVSGGAKQADADGSSSSVSVEIDSIPL